MAELFDTTRDNITMHIKNIFEEGELQKNSVSKESLLTAKDGKNYKTKFYNLDLIISVGYRVNSKETTDFRIWATNTLKEFIKKGFVLNDELAKSINEFLEFRRYDILRDNGKISRKKAEEKAEKEYIKFNKTQKITSDFAKLLLESKKLENKI